MRPTTRESQLLIMSAGILLVVAVATYWFTCSDVSSRDVTSSEVAVDVAPVESGARRSVEVKDPSRTTAQESGSHQVDEKIAASAGSAGRSESPSVARSGKQLFLSIRFSDIEASELSVYSFDVSPLRLIQGNSPIAFAFPEDGSPAEVDVTVMREAIEEGHGFSIHMHRGLSLSVTSRYDLDALTRHGDEAHDIFDVLMSRGEMAIVRGRLIKSEEADAEQRPKVYAYIGARAVRNPSMIGAVFNDWSFESLLDRRKRWTLVCAAKDHQLISLDVPPHTRSLFDLGTSTLPLGEFVAGRVTRQGLPRAGSVVRAVLKGRESALDAGLRIGDGLADYCDGRLIWIDVTTMTDADGSYRIQGLERRRYDVGVVSAEEGSEAIHESLRSRLSREIVASASGVDFEFASVELKISVHDEWGPLRDWLMSLTTPDGKAWSVTAVDETGVRIIHLPAEAHVDVVVEHKGHEAFRGRISLPVGESSVAYDVAMTPIADARLSVRVRDHEALGVHRLLAVVKSPIDHEVPMPTESSPQVQRALAPMFCTADVDADGRFVFEDFRLKKGRHEILFRPLGRELVMGLVASTINVEVDPERETVLEIMFERGGYARFAARKASGIESEGRAHLRDKHGIDIVEGYYWVTPSGLGFHSESPFEMETGRLPDVRFSRTRQPLSPGRYRIDFEADDGTKRSADFEIRAGETTDVIVDF